MSGLTLRGSRIKKVVFEKRRPFFGAPGRAHLLEGEASTESSRSQVRICQRSLTDFLIVFTQMPRKRALKLEVADGIREVKLGALLDNRH